MAEPIKKCSFCGRPKNEVKKLIESSDGGARICNRCTGSSYRAIEEEEKNSPTSKEEPLKTPQEILSILDSYIIAQDDAKREMAIAIHEHALRREISNHGGSFSIETPNGETEEVEIEKSNILLMGPSGTGKTLLARSIARLLQIPFYVGDATRLTQAGYVGDDVESLLQGLIADANGNLENAQWGIIFLDEIDKLARKSGRSVSGYRDVTGEGVQQAILKILEGSKVPVPRGMGSKMVVSGGAPADMIDTTNILFIGAGSFAGIEEVVSHRLNSHTRVGFGNELTAKQTKTDIYRQVTEEDVESFGIIPEMVGRLPVITSTYALTQSELVEILTKPKNAIVKQFKSLYRMSNIDLQFDDEALVEIAKKASVKSTGARALRSVVKKILKPYSYEAPSDKTITAIRITAEAVISPEKAIVVRKGAAVA